MATTPLQRTNVTSMSTKAIFCEPCVWDGKFGCPLCSFQGKDTGYLKKHYQSEEHRKEFLKRMKGPDANSSFYEKDEDETEQEYSKRAGLAFVLGVLPSYVSVTEKYGTFWFSHALKKSHRDSLSSRERRGEVGLLSPQQYAHAFGKISGHSMFFAYETNKFSRSFGSYPSFSNFWENYGKVPDEEKRFNDQFLEGQTTREIFDLDSSRLSKEEAEELDIPQLFMKLRQEFEKEEKLKFFILEACGQEGEKYKVSYHIIVSKVHYDIVRMGKSVSDFVDFLKKTKEGSVLAELIDKQIYTRNRTIRSPWSIKHEGKRRLIPIKEQMDLDPINFFATPDADIWYQEEQYEEEENPIGSKLTIESNGEYEDVLMSFVEEKLDGVFDVQREGNGWRLQRQDEQANFCPFCEREHDGDNYRAHVWNDRLWVKCFRYGKCVPITAAPKTRGTTQKIVLEKVPELKADFCYNSSVSRPVYFEKKCFAVRGAMGTGKTKALEMYLKLHQQARVLSVTYRRTLARETSCNLPGFKNYEDEGSGRIWGKRIVVQVDSLHRVFGQFDLLVLDEVTYTLSRLLCDVSEKNACWRHFKHFVQNTPNILLMDKNLDQPTVDFFEKLGAPCYVSRNEYKAHSKKKVLVSPSFLEFKEKLLDELSNGKKICFPCSSKKKLLLVCHEAKEAGHRVLWYTGDGKSEDVWLEEWDEYDLVAYTPTISAGVSYEQKHFDKIYGYFSSRSCCAEEAEQMMFRVRDIADNEIVLGFDNRGSNCPVTRQGIIDELEIKDSASFALSGVEWDIVRGKLVDSPKTDAYVSSVLRRNISRKNMTGALLGLLAEQGANIEFLPSSIRGKELEELREDTKFLQKKIDFEGAKKTCESVSLDRERFSFLCSKRDKSENEIASCRKFMVAHSFEVEQETLTPEFVLEYSGKEKIFQNQRLAFAGSKAEQKERLTRAVEKKTQDKRFTKFEKRLGMSYNLERVVYARRLFYWLGYGSTTTREKKSKEEMSMRLEKIRKMVKKSKHFQTLLGKMPDDEQYMVRWINDILRRMFDCYIAKTSRGKSFSWELMFLSPWRHNGETTSLPKKRIKNSEVCPSPF
ncbi:putative helicase [Port-miou virus]|uniref:Putative helicase n=1 Tax=Port-miou virus TaxID=1733873 RepID=A0A0N9PHI2_9VIRU|nr:putative helicase [Port-miou virus]